MRILNICTLLPYPVTDGSRAGVYYPVKHLAARGHEIVFACLSESMDTESIRHMESFCRVEIKQARTKPTIHGVLGSLFSSESYDLRRFQNPGLMQHILSVVGSTSIDVVEVGLHSAWYGLELKRRFGLPVVLRVHNVHWINFARSIAHWRNPLLKLYIKNDAEKIRRQELEIYRSVDLNLTVSDHDADILHTNDPDIRTKTVPAGVELEEFREERPNEEPDSVLWMGSLGWKPNQDSFYWFLKEIVPELVRLNPGVKVTVIGSNAPGEIMSIRHPNVSILGFVDDVKRYLYKCKVAVVPLRIGSGIRIKLLEMFAARCAVVSTSVGCEGLGLTHNKELLIADDPREFAKAVVGLLSDDNKRRELGDNGRKHVEKNYNWKEIAAEYERAYSSIIGESKSRHTRVQS